MTEPKYVYVLRTQWDTPDNEGAEVLGVYSESGLDKARARMRHEASKIKLEYPFDIWQSDYTWEEPDEIHLGFDPGVYLVPATVYGWNVEKFEITK